LLSFFFVEFSVEQVEKMGSEAGDFEDFFYISALVVVNIPHSRMMKMSKNIWDNPRNNQTYLI